MADDTATSFSRTPDDPTPYIRTYAKDVARLTGTQAGQHAGPVKDAPTPGVQFADVDMSQTQGVRGEGASPREFPQETISVTKEDTVENLNASAPAEHISADKRDEILTRLRAKVQPDASATAVPAPVAPAPIVSPPAPAPKPWASVPTPPAPQPAPAAPTLEPFAPQPVSVPKPRAEFPLFGRHEPKTAAPQPSAESNLHTFKSDFADRIDSQQASKFSVLAAQGDAPEARANAPQPIKLPTKNKNRLPMILAASILVVLGIGGLGGAYWFVVLRSPATAAPFTVPSLIFADEKAELPSDASPMLALAQAAKQPSVPGNVVVTYLTTTTSGKRGLIRMPQPGGALIKQLFATAPDILLRNIDDSSTVGIIDAGDQNAPFFLLHVTSYERTFAGMLGWEPTIGSDLAALYPPPPGTTLQSADADHFIDSTVANHDVRILKDSANNTILLYGYRDKDLLIIARDEAAFTALLTRLNAANGS